MADGVGFEPTSDRLTVGFRTCWIPAKKEIQLSKICVVPSSAECDTGDRDGVRTRNLLIDSQTRYLLRYAAKKNGETPGRNLAIYLLACVFSDAT